jgi:hypothetical protein
MLDMNRLKNISVSACIVTVGLALWSSPGKVVHLYS